MNTVLKVIYDVSYIKLHKTIKAAVIAVDKTTGEDVPGFTFTWLLNKKKIGEGVQVIKKNFPVEGVTKYRLKVVATMKNVGSIIRTITIIMKQGENIFVFKVVW